MIPDTCALVIDPIEASEKLLNPFQAQIKIHRLFPSQKTPWHLIVRTCKERKYYLKSPPHGQLIKSIHYSIMKA